MRAFPSIQDRSYIYELLENENVIPQKYLYRPDDPYFGKSRYIRYDHQFGVYVVDSKGKPLTGNIPAGTKLSNQFYNPIYSGASAINENFYNKSITLGSLQTAVARDANQNIIYEVVYSQIIDNLVNNAGVSVSKEINWPRDIPLPSGPWFTSTTKILDSYAYYTAQPLVRRVTSVNRAGKYVTLNTLEGLTNGVPSGGWITFGDNVPVDPTTKSTPTIQIDNSGNVRFYKIPVFTPDNLLDVNWVNRNQLLYFSRRAYTALSTNTLLTTQGNTLLYPNSLDNMRTQIASTVGVINNNTVLPLWMTSAQSAGVTLGYTPAWVICYTKPGFSATVLNSIKVNWEKAFGNTLNKINFEVNMFELDATESSGVPLPNNDNDAYVYLVDARGQQRKTILPNPPL
jgi:hypothetical protein